MFLFAIIFAILGVMLFLSYLKLTSKTPSNRNKDDSLVFATFWLSIACEILSAGLLFFAN